MQIAEFGQVPQQVFSRPHPRRNVSLGLYDALYLSPNRDTACPHQPNQQKCSQHSVATFSSSLDASSLGICLKWKQHQTSNDNSKFCDIHGRRCDACAGDYSTPFCGDNSSDSISISDTVCDTSSCKCSVPFLSTPYYKSPSCSNTILYEPGIKEKCVNFCMTNYLCNPCLSTRTHNTARAATLRRCSAALATACQRCTASHSSQRVCAQWNCKLNMCPCVCGEHVVFSECEHLPPPLDQGSDCLAVARDDRASLPFINASEACQPHEGANAHCSEEDEASDVSCDRGYQAPFFNDNNNEATKFITDSVGQTSPKSSLEPTSGFAEDSTESPASCDAAQQEPATGRRLTDVSSKLPPLAIPVIRLQEAAPDDPLTPPKEGTSKIQELFSMIKTSTLKKPRTGKTLTAEPDGHAGDTCPAARDLGDGKGCPPPVNPFFLFRNYLHKFCAFWCYFYGV